MLTALDALKDALDVHEQNFVEQIRNHGWFRTSVFEDENGPGFSYTTGFWSTLGHPELIIFSMKSEIVHQVFWDVYKDIKEGKTLAISKPMSDVFANLEACFIPVDKRYYREYLGWSRWFYAGDDFPCLQLVWPDRQGVFPWQSAMDSQMATLQPDLSQGDWGQAGT